MTSLLRLGLLALHFILTVSMARAETVQAVVPETVPETVASRSASFEAVAADFRAILTTANLSPKLITLVRKAPNARGNHAEIVCTASSVSPQTITIEIQAQDEEWGATAYYSLQMLGFLFPHPRWQISPSREKMSRHCGEHVTWEPRFRDRGFHLHTLHPSEWMQGFFMGKKEIARDELRWLARNQQNIVQVVLLAQTNDAIQKELGDLIPYAHGLGLRFGIDASVEMIQQHIYRLVGRRSKWQWLWLTLLGHKAKARAMVDSINDLSRRLDFDFMTIEVGTSEFTSTDYQAMIDQINLANATLRAQHRALFVKIHSSINQVDEHFGNFNFLAAYADPSVGVLPHTLVYYGLGDARTPVYGRKDFADMREFTAHEAKKRPVWYYPETAYFCAIDIDIPLFLTDYLQARSDDMDLVEKLGVPGHLTFTTGEELGYWLFDWTIALMINKAHAGDPLAGLKLLGEDPKVWRNILTFQTRYIKLPGLLAELSSPNLLDELPNIFGHRTIDRFLFRELRKDPKQLHTRLNLLEDAWAARPDLHDVKNAELRLMLQVTEGRLHHALLLREALQSETLAAAAGPTPQKESVDSLEEARGVRLQALRLMESEVRTYNRYPEALIFEHYENLTSYPYGYGWTAANLHFWEREEEQLRQHVMNPFFMNIYAIQRLIL